MSDVEDSVIDREEVQSVVDRSTEMLRQLPTFADVTDSVAARQASLVRDALTRIQKSGEFILLMTLKISVRPPAFDVWSDSKLKSFLVQTEVLQQQVRKQAEQASATLAPDLQPLMQALENAFQNLFNVLEQHRQAALEHEADRDIRAGRVKKFGNAVAALAYLKRQAD